MSSLNKEYLGDSVYANVEGGMIVLTTENGYADDPRNRICLEPAVLDALVRFIARLDERRKGPNPI